MRDRALWLMLRAGRSRLLGIAVAVASIAAETLVLYPLRDLAPKVSLGVVYLFGVLVVSSMWGLALGVVTAVLSVVAYDYFHVPPVASIVFGTAQNQAALVVLLFVSLLLSFVAAFARSRANELAERRREADVAAEMARVLLRADELRSALPEASVRLARALGVSTATIELEAVAAGESRTAFPLRDGHTRLGTLLLPVGLSPRMVLRVRERVVPAVEALMRAAREREAMGTALRASRDELRVLADEQAALRRVATVAARGAEPQDVFAAVVEEIGRLLPVEFVEMGRFSADRTMTIVGAWGIAVDQFGVGSRWNLEGRNLSTIVFETGRPARIESYADASGPVGVTARELGFSASVATPIIVEGAVWGVVIAGSTHEATMPADTEARLARFTKLLATAIANAESRADLTRLADEQAALRRVATLVARSAPPEEVFSAVVAEVGRLLPVDIVGMGRYESDGTQTIVAAWGGATKHFPVGARLRLGGQNLATTVHETGRRARMDDYGDASGQVGLAARETGFRSSVGTPIVVEDRLWGVMVAGSSSETLAADTEARLADFTELVATAIANAESRAALAATRAPIVAAADATRRRIERDLHDGIQQRLVSLILQLRAAHGAVPEELAEFDAELLRVAEGLESVFDELREISRGIHPAILSQGGLGPALGAVARRCAVPVKLDLRRVGRLPGQVEVAAYYVVSEALTNAVKYARATAVHVALEVRDSTLTLAIRDDGIGGADPAHGSGLIGLSDRIEALGGRLIVASPAGGGTTLRAEIPVEAPSGSGTASPQASSEQ